MLAWLARDRVRGRSDLARRVTAAGARSWAGAAIAFLVTDLVLFTTFGTDPGHWDGLWEGLDYWLGQHGVGRGGEAWFFYIVILALEEWPVVALGVVGAVAVARRPTPLRVFAVWGFVVSLVVYSWAGEKFSWLVLHPLLPLLLLAGIGVQAIWQVPRPVARRAGLALVAVCAVYVGLSSWWVNAVHRADPRELLVSTQSSEQVLGVRDRVLALAAESPDARGRPLTVTVDTAEGATFPWAWYFRDISGIAFQDLSQPAAGVPSSDVLILTAGAYQRLAADVEAYTARSFPFRVWWVRDYGELTPGSALEWILRREPWNPVGGMPEWLLVRPPD